VCSRLGTTYSSWAPAGAPSLERGLHYRLLRPALATSGVKDPELAVLDGRAPKQLSKENGLQPDKTKREPEKEGRNVRQERRKQTIDADMGLGSHPSARLAAAQLAAMAALINDCRRPIECRGRTTEMLWPHYRRTAALSGLAAAPLLLPSTSLPRHCNGETSHSNPRIKEQIASPHPWRCFYC